jgi:hypothetical protein
MFEMLLSKINGNQGSIGLLLILSLAGNTYANYQADQVMKGTLSALSDQMAFIEDSLYEMKYGPSYETIKRGLAGLNHEEAIEKIKFWVDEEWVAKVVDLDKLCEEPDRKHLIKLAGIEGSVDYCRALH